MSPDMQITLRNRIVAGVATALGLLAGISFAVIGQPVFKGSAAVVISPAASCGPRIRLVSYRDSMPSAKCGHGSTNVLDQVAFAGSETVLRAALVRIRPAMSLVTLRDDIRLSAVTDEVILITGKGQTRAQAESVVNAVADSYVSLAGKTAQGCGALVLDPAAIIGASRRVNPLAAGGLSAVLGALAGAIVSMAFSRRGSRRTGLAGA
jgi:hypothetical protein